MGKLPTQSKAGAHALIGATLGQSVVAFRPQIARSLGSPLAALFICQAAYWQSKVGEGNWWYKLRDAQKNEAGDIVPPTSADRQSWEWELGMSRSEQQTARKILIARKLLETDLRGIPAKTHYLVNLDVLAEFLLEGQQVEANHQLAESCQLDGEIEPASENESVNLPDTNQPSNKAKITTEITHTTTTHKETHLAVPSSGGPPDANLNKPNHLTLVKEFALESFFSQLLKILKQENVTDQQTAQDLLDELAGAVEAGQRGQRHRIGSPPAFLRSLIARWKGGTFDKVHSLAIQERRRRPASTETTKTMISRTLEFEQSAGDASLSNRSPEQRMQAKHALNEAKLALSGKVHHTIKSGEI